MQQLRSSTIAKGSDRDDVFNERLGPLVVGAPELLVIDRYLANDILQRGDKSVFSWFLAMVWGVRDTDVLLMSARTQNTGLTAKRFGKIVERCRESSGTQSKVGIWLTGDDRFKGDAHDRFIGATIGGRSVGVSVGKGLQAFSARKFSQTSTSQFLSGGTFLQDIPSALGFSRSTVAWY